MTTNRRTIWNFWEDLALEYLVKNGYTVIERNATFRGGELDIIATHKGFWRCVEVKYRETTLFGMPEDAMTPKKIKTLLRSIEFYCLKKNIELENFRLDFLGILKLSDGNYEYRLIKDISA